MPLYMEGALTVTPPCNYQHRRPMRLQPLTRQHQLLSKSRDRHSKKSDPMRPFESRIFTKLYENSYRLMNAGHRSNECKQRFSSTPIDNDVTKAPTCCRHHWELHQEGRRHQVDAVQPYNDVLSPPAPASAVLQKRGAPDRLVKLVEKDLETNLRKQLPLPTIIVRWHRFRDKPCYNVTSVFDVLRQFGQIDNITMTSHVSARVTFRDLDSACRAVGERFIGPEDNAILCLWFHYSMANKAFYIRRRHLHVVYDPYTSETI